MPIHLFRHACAAEQYQLVKQYALDPMNKHKTIEEAVEDLGDRATCKFSG